MHRSDGSGTTFNWVNYLSKVSPEWQDKVGEGTSVSWPTGVGGKGNEGVAAYVKQIKGSIGYVELAYATQNGMAYASMQNAAGNWVRPSAESFQAAAASADWANSKDFSLIITNAPGADAWPVAATNFILMYKQPKDAKRSQDAIDFFTWALENGQPWLVMEYLPSKSLAAMLLVAAVATAGGFKVSTLTVLVLRAWNSFLGSARIHVARRTVPEEVVDRAITTAFLFAGVVVLGAPAQVPVGAVHDVVNRSSEPATSIHVYSPPLSQMTYYDPATLRPVETVRLDEEPPVLGPQG